MFQGRHIYIYTRERERERERDRERVKERGRRREAGLLQFVKTDLVSEEHKVVRP